MNKQLLKKIRDEMPEPLKRVLGSFFRLKLTSHHSYKKYLKLLYEFKNWTVSDLEEFQLKSLKETLIFAQDNVPYYKRIFKDSGFNAYDFRDVSELEKIPVLTKELIRENYEELKSIVPVKNGFYSATTGGSTGEPLKILLDFNGVFAENAFVNFFRSQFGYTLSCSMVTFRGLEFGKKLWKYNPMFNDVTFSPFKLSELTVEKYVTEINKISPKFLNGYPSTLYYLAKLMSEQHLSFAFDINCIFLISESIDVNQREFIEVFFKTKTMSFYGHTERCVIASEIEKNLYEFNPIYGYTELINNGSENEFTIIGTSFIHKTMPLIRYKTDDVAIRSIIGLKEGFFIDGSRKSNSGIYGYNREFFTQAAFNFHSEIFNNVVRYQFVQSKLGKVDLLLVPNTNFNRDKEVEVIKREIDKKTKGVIDFNVLLVNEVQLSSRGKYQMYISKIKLDDSDSEERSKSKF